MGRISDQDRLAIIDAFIAHWQQADLQNGSPILIALGYGVAELISDRNDFFNRQQDVSQLVSDLIAARANRDTVWGISPEDETGVWFKLKQYKPLVRARLGARSPFSRTVPNLGQVFPIYYLKIIESFMNHWERVNSVLNPDLTLGSFALANLQVVHSTIQTQQQLIEQIEQALLPLAREEREQLFGDEAADVRTESSIISRLVLYHATINVLFPNQPLADSLPQIFPAGSSPTLPTFRFNWSQQPAGVLNTWLENPGLFDAVTVFLKEGLIEQTLFFDPEAGDVIQQTWNGVEVVDDLDELELRNASGATVALGIFDATLPEPV